MSHLGALKGPHKVATNKPPTSLQQASSMGDPEKCAKMAHSEPGILRAPVRPKARPARRADRAAYRDTDRSRKLG